MANVKAGIGAALQSAGRSWEDYARRQQMEQFWSQEGEKRRREREAATIRGEERGREAQIEKEKREEDIWLKRQDNIRKFEEAKEKRRRAFDISEKEKERKFKAIESEKTRKLRRESVKPEKPNIKTVGNRVIEIKDGKVTTLAEYENKGQALKIAKDIIIIYNTVVSAGTPEAVATANETLRQQGIGMEIQEIPAEGWFGETKYKMVNTDPAEIR